MKIQGRSIVFDSGLRVSFKQTLRLPEDGKTHSLPPGLGEFPIKRVEDYKDTVPKSWLAHGGVFIPMFQREAMWMAFSGNKPTALKVAAGKINAVNGKPWTDELCGLTTEECLTRTDASATSDPKQDYMVCGSNLAKGHHQPWIDGFNSGEGEIKQFVAMPLGMGYTVEGQVTGKEDFGGIQLLCVPAKAGAIPEPKRSEYVRSGALNSYNPMEAQEDYCLPSSLCIPSYESNYSMGGLSSAAKGAVYGAKRSMNSVDTGGTRGLLASVATKSVSRPTVKAAEMGLGAGGKMRQSIYADLHGVDVWDQTKVEKVFVHIVNSEMYKQITGENPPESPVTAKSYAAQGLPWFDIYDEGVEKVSPSTTLAGVKTISEMDDKHGFVGQMDNSPISETNIVTYKKKTDPNEITNGKW